MYLVTVNYLGDDYQWESTPICISSSLESVNKLLESFKQACHLWRNFYVSLNNFRENWNRNNVFDSSSITFNLVKPEYPVQHPCLSKLPKKEKKNNRYFLLFKEELDIYNEKLIDFKRLEKEYNQKVKDLLFIFQNKKNQDEVHFIEMSKINDMIASCFATEHLFLIEKLSFFIKNEKFLIDHVHLDHQLIDCI